LRTQTFIVSMASALVFAGAAQATVSGFSAIDSFTTAGSAVGNIASASTGGQYVDELGSFGLSGYRQLAGQFWGNQSGAKGTATLNQSSSVVIGSGSMNMSYSGTKTIASTTGVNKAWVNSLDGNSYMGGLSDQVTRQTAQASFSVDNAGYASDWSTLTSLSFDIANYSKSGLSTANSPHLYLSVVYLTYPIDSASMDWRVFDITIANGMVSLSNSDFTTAGVNLSAMLSVSLYLENTYTTALGGTTGRGNIPGASLDISNFGVSNIPAPGAVALIGLAGMVAGRRRRN
jgi:hypothetical protein